MRDAHQCHHTDVNVNESMRELKRLLPAVKGVSLASASAASSKDFQVFHDAHLMGLERLKHLQNANEALLH